MIRKHINTDENYEPKYLSDCQRIQEVLLTNGYESTLRDCEGLWSDYSDMLAAGWIFLPESDERIWLCLESKVKERAILDYYYSL